MPSLLKKTNDKLVSIIVPIYKVEAYLDQCIASILQQTYSNFELILVNDGSPDNCPAMCDAYAEQDYRIQVIHKENGGLSSAVKAGLQIAQGDFVYFVDSDDYIAPKALQNLYEVRERGNYDLVVSSFYKVINGTQIPIDAFNIRSGSYTKEEIEKKLIPQLLYSPINHWLAVAPNRWAKLFRRDILLKNIHLYREDISHGEDWLMTLPYFLSVESMYLLPHSYDYYYRTNPESLTQVINPHATEEMLLFIGCLKQILAELAPLRTLCLKQLDMIVLLLTFGHLQQLRQLMLKESHQLVQQKMLHIVVQPYINRKITLSSLPFKRRSQIWLIQKKAYRILYWYNFLLEMRFRRKSNANN